MAQAARLPLPSPEVAVVEEGTLEEQTLVLALELPERPLVLGGDCCAHIGAVEGLAARHERLALVWLDARGDLNTPETSPSGNRWGMPLRMLLDAGTVTPDCVAHVGARSLDPPEQVYLTGSGIHTGETSAPNQATDQQEIYVINTDGSHKQRLTHNTTHDLAPACQPLPRH